MKKEKGKKTLPWYFIPAWSTDSISQSLSFIVLAYLTYYCTNVVGLPATVVGTMLLVAKLTDGVTDLIASIVIERTNTRWGKGRPYALMMPIAWIFIIFMFSTPNISQMWQVFYIFVCYFMINSVCITLIYAAEPVYLARSLKNPEDATTVYSMTQMIMRIPGAVLTIVFPLIISKIGVDPHSWTLVVLALGVPCCLLSPIRFAFIKERDDIPATSTADGHHFGFGDILRILAGNVHIIVLALIQLLANIFSGVTMAVATYYFQYIMGDIKIQSTVSIVTTFSSLVLLAIPALVKRTSVRKVMILGMLFGVIGNVMKVIPNIYVLMVANFLTALASLPTTALLPTLFLECMDYHE